MLGMENDTIHVSMRITLNTLTSDEGLSDVLHLISELAIVPEDPIVSSCHQYLELCSKNLNGFGLQKNFEHPPT